MERYIEKTSVRAILVLLIISLLIPLTAFNVPSVAYAADGAAVNFDSTDVMDDLNGSALNGVPFNVADYPYDKDGELQVLGFVGVQRRRNARRIQQVCVAILWCFGRRGS